MNDYNDDGFVDADVENVPADDYPHHQAVVMSPAEVEYQRLKARRDAQDQLDRERASVVPARMGRRHISDVVAAAVQEVEVQHEYGVTGLSIGIPEVDKHLRRAMMPGHVVVVAASSKSGKTAFTGNMVVSFAAQGAPVLLGSFEDIQTDTSKRYLANLSAGDVGAIRDGFRRPDGSKMPIPGNFDEAADRLSALSIELMTEAGTVEQIASETKDWVESTVAGQGAPFGVLVIDQMSHVIPSNPAKFRADFRGYEEPPPAHDLVKRHAWQMRMLRRIAKKWNVLVIVCVQLNENHEEWQVPNERSVRESRGIVHEADAVIGPWRPRKLPNTGAGVGEPKFVENTEGRAWIYNMLGRQVQPFLEPVQWDGPGQRFLPLDADRNAPWSAPATITAKQAEGMLKLAALRAQWNAGTDAIQEGANTRQPALESAGALTSPARPRLVTDPTAAWEKPAPMPVASLELESSGPPAVSAAPRPVYDGPQPAF